MASPAVTWYGCPSGGVVAGGRFRLPAWRRAITAGSWGEIPSTLLSSIDPKNNPAYNPNHPSAAPWNRLASGGVNVPSVNGLMIPWCGGAWDDEKCRFWLPLSGGHSDTGDNGNYYVGLKVDAPEWVMNRPPSGSVPLISGGLPAGSTPQGNSFLLDDGLETSGVHADGRPRAIHSYRKHVYVPGLGPVMVVQGGCFSSASKSTKHTWLMDETTGEWTWKSTASSAHISESSGGAACYDSTRGCIYWLGGGTAKLLRLDLDTWTFSVVMWDTISSTGDECIVYIPEYDIVVEICSFFATKFCVRDVATSVITSPTTTGTAQSVNGGTGVAWVPGVGLVFDVSGVLWSLSPTGNPRSDPWAWAQLTQTGTPPANTGNGMWSKFGYSPMLKCLYRFTDANTKPWAFALE